MRSDVPSSHAEDRRALTSVGAQFWMNGVVVASFVPRLPEIRNRLGVDTDRLGLLLTLGVVGGFAASALCGRAIDRFGTKRVMTAASLGIIAVIPLLGLAATPVAFVAALAAFQFFDVLIDVPMNLQGAWLSGRREVPVMHRLHGLWSVGTVCGGVVATAAASRVALEIHLGAVSVLLLASLALIVPGLLRVDGPDPGGGAADGVDLAADAGSRHWASIARFGALGAVAIVAEIVPLDWAAIRLVDDVGADPGIAGLGFVAFTAGMVIGRFGGDTASARLGPRRLSYWATGIGAVGLTVAAVSPALWAALTGFLIAGLGVAVVFPGLYELAARAPGRPGDLLGAMTAGIRLGLLVIPTTIGAIAAGRPTVGQAMLLVGLPATVALVVLRSTAERP